MRELPEPFCGYQICHFKERLKKWEKGEKEKYWESLPDRSQSRILIKYSTKRAKEFLELSKLEMRKITGLLTGHCSKGIPEKNRQNCRRHLQTLPRRKRANMSFMNVLQWLESN